MLLYGFMVIVAWQSEQELVALDPMSFDLGEVKPGSEHSLTVAYNVVSEHPVEFKHLLSTCPCPIVVGETRLRRGGDPITLQSHERGFLQLTYRAPVIGSFQDYAIVTMADEATGLEQLNRIHVNGNVSETSQVTPPELVFGEGGQMQQGLGLRMADMEGKALQARVLAVEPDYLSVEQVETGEWFVRPKDDIWLKAGRDLKGSIQMSYDWDGTSIQRRVPFEIHVEQICSPDSTHVLFGRVKSQGDLVKTAYIDCPDQVDITDVEQLPSYLDVRYGNLSGSRMVVYLKLTSRPPDRFSDDVLLKTNVEGRPVRLRVAGRILEWPNQEEQALGDQK